jgi:hypothetical protein
MSRPEFVTEEDIARWQDVLDNDDRLPKPLLASAIIKEVCFAGLWLAEELENSNCPEDIIVRIQFTHGRLSFGRDPWKAAQTLLDGYRKGELSFESDEDEKLN